MNENVTLSIVAARGLQNELGQRGQLPWKMPDDLKRFKAITLEKPIIMGRKTFVSIGRPLPKRHNIVISRDAAFVAEGCEVVGSLDDAITAASKHGAEAMLIGGAQLFQEALPRCARMYLTTVMNIFPEADVFFPKFSSEEWRVESRQDFPADEKNPYACCVEEIVRV